MEQVTTMGSTIRKLLLAVAILATGIGGAVIMSITLIGVSERRKEIGVRRAAGASRGAILLQFLLEATCCLWQVGSSESLLALGEHKLYLGFNTFRFFCSRKRFYWRRHSQLP